MDHLMDYERERERALLTKSGEQHIQFVLFLQRPFRFNEYPLGQPSLAV